jgi:hypothetical protein
MPFICAKADKKITDGYRYFCPVCQCNYCWSCSKGYCPKDHTRLQRFKIYESGGCFITTAVMLTLGKPDDCEELSAFRSFRDNWLMKQANGNQLINEYYEIAPSIVAKIDSQVNAGEIYLRIWTKSLRVCFELIREGNNSEAYAQYEKMMKELRKTYL